MYGLIFVSRFNVRRNRTDKKRKKFKKRLAFFDGMCYSNKGIRAVLCFGLGMNVLEI